MSSRKRVLALAGLIGCALQEHVPPHFVARHELALTTHKPLGVIGVDVDGDGRSELACAAQSPGALLVWDAEAQAIGFDPRRLVIAIGGYPLGPRKLSLDGKTRLALAS